jgi:hypothetical protein
VKAFYLGEPDRCIAVPFCRNTPESPVEEQGRIAGTNYVRFGKRLTPTEGQQKKESWSPPH